MRAREFTSSSKNDQNVDEFVQALAPIAGAIGRGALALGQGALKGAQVAGNALAQGAKTVGSTVAQGAKTAGSALAQGAKTVGTVANQVGTVAKQVGNVASASSSIADKLSGQQQQQGQTLTPSQFQAALPKPGSTISHPKLGQLKVLQPGPGQKGIKLDTTDLLGYPVIIDPRDMQEL